MRICRHTLYNLFGVQYLEQHYISITIYAMQHFLFNFLNLFVEVFNIYGIIQLKLLIEVIAEVGSMEKPIATLKERLHEAMNLREKKAADLSRDLNIPKSAISQYMSGSSKKMDSARMYSICKYLDVSEAWMMGFDVPMQRVEQKYTVTTSKKDSDTIIAATVKMKNNAEYIAVIELLNEMDDLQLSKAKKILQAFFE